MRALFLSLCVVVLPALAACSTPMVQGAAPDAGFASLVPLRLDVSNISVTDSTQGARPETGGYGVKIIQPQQALQNYVRHRLHAQGSVGFLNVNIQQASLTAQKLPPEGKWTDKLNLVGAPTEYTFTTRVGLALSGTGQGDIKSAYTLERKATIPANATMGEREHDINALIIDTILDLDSAITQGLRDTMRIVNDAPATPYISSAPLPLR